MANLEIVIWDVQHGSAAYIKTPNGTDIVIDLGTGDVSESNLTFSPLLHLKNVYKVNQLDWVIITHPHRDHFDDINNFDELSPRVLTRPKHLSERDIRDGNQTKNGLVDKYIEINSKYNHPILENENPRLPANNGNVKIQTFIPSNCDRANLNNHSVVTILEYAGSKIIIPGDNEPPSWLELLKQNDFVEAIKGTDILVAPHHGRESAYCPELFDHFKPQLTIISDGPADTTAVSKYSSISKGWTVFHRNGEKETRYCLTTRKDGAVVIKFGTTSDTNKPFLNVTID